MPGNIEPRGGVQADLFFGFPKIFGLPNGKALNVLNRGSIRNHRSRRSLLVADHESVPMDVRRWKLTTNLARQNASSWRVSLRHKCEHSTCRGLHSLFAFFPGLA